MCIYLILYMQSIYVRKVEKDYPLAEKFGQYAFNLSLAGVIFILVLIILIIAITGLSITFSRNR